MVCYGIFWSGQFEQRDEEINAEKIIAAKYATKESLEKKFKLAGIGTLASVTPVQRTNQLS